MSDNQQLIEIQTMQEANNKLQSLVIAPTDEERNQREQELIAILDKKEGLWDRFFPKVGRRVTRDEAIRELQQITNDRIEAAKLLQANRMAQAKAYANAHLIGLEVNLRRQLTVFAENELEIVQSVMSDKDIKIFSSLKQKLDELDVLYGNGENDNLVKEMNRKTILRQLETQLEVSNKLIEGFKKALDSKIPN